MDINKLREFKKLLDSGAINKEEFEHLKSSFFIKYKEYLSKEKEFSNISDVNQSSNKDEFSGNQKEENKSNPVGKVFADTRLFWSNYYNYIKTSNIQEFKGITLEEWVVLSKSDGEISSVINSALSYPFLKSEHIICFYNEFILTNYRLIIADVSIGSPSIPLSKIKSYFNNDDGVLEFESEGKILKLQFREWLHQNNVNSAIFKNEERNLSEFEKEFLKYDRKAAVRKHPNIEIPVLDWLQVSTNVNHKKVKSIIEQNNGDNHFNSNIFKWISSLYNNKPWWFLIAIAAFIGESFWTLTCCVMPSIKLDYEMNGWQTFVSWDGVILLVFYVIPIFLSILAAVKMVKHFVTGENYPGGEGPYGVIQFGSLIFYLLVVCYVFKMWYDLLSS